MSKSISWDMTSWMETDTNVVENKKPGKPWLINIRWTLLIHFIWNWNTSFKIILRFYYLLTKRMQLQIQRKGKFYCYQWLYLGITPGKSSMWNFPPVPNRFSLTGICWDYLKQYLPLMLEMLYCGLHFKGGHFIFAILFSNAKN